jgi:hypothetical protein
MDSLKLIPSVFFDVIARGVPGATAIVAYLLLSGTTWSHILEKTLGPTFAEKDALLTATALFFVAAYVVGQLIAPLAKLAQRIGEWKYLYLKLGRKITKKAKAKRSQRVSNWKYVYVYLKWRVKVTTKAKPKENAYDFLRLHHKEAGSQCAKIRAEFTMYNGLSVVFLASSIYYPRSSTMWKWSVLAILVGATILTAYRGRTTRDTFNTTVIKFKKAADDNLPRTALPNKALPATREDALG